MDPRSPLALLAGLWFTFAWAAPEPTKGCATDREGRVVCPAPDSTCLNDRYGDVVCSPPGGGIELDRYGSPLCGPGYCIRDQRGDLFCSSEPRGAAATDRYGNAACAVACVPAKAQSCVKPKAVR